MLSSACPGGHRNAGIETRRADNSAGSQPRARLQLANACDGAAAMPISGP